MFAKVRCTCFLTQFLLVFLFAGLRVPVIGLQQTEMVKDENGVTPPIEFPKNESTYPFRHNQTILDALASHTSNDTEVDDLRSGGQFFNMTHRTSSAPKETENGTVEASTGPADPKSQVEEIEDGTDTEDSREERNGTAKDGPKSKRNRETSYGTKMPVVQGQLAAILAGTFVAIAVIGYVGMLSWRRFLETRYGNREMLVNEEDFYDPNDMRHFSL